MNFVFTHMGFLFLLIRIDLIFEYLRYTGFYKGVQSAGAAIAWQIDTQKVSFLNELITNWALMTVSFPLLALLILRAVKDDDEVERKSKEGGAIPGIH